MNAHSTNSWVVAIKNGDVDAAQILWDKFAVKLAQLAKKHLLQYRDSPDDEDDIAIKAFKSFVVRAEKRQFPRLDGREDFWSIVACITIRKAWAANKQKGERRIPKPLSMDAPMTASNAGESDSDMAWANQFTADDLCPEDLLIMKESMIQLMDALDETLQDVARLRYEGYTVSEIGEELGFSKATAERKLKLIRNIWIEQFPEIEILYS